MKLKRKIAFGLSFFYLVNVIGIALSLHFCGGKLANVKLYSSATSCKLCGSIPAYKKVETDCCKNTKIDVKVKDDHQSQAEFKLQKLFAVDLFLPHIFYFNFKFLPSFSVTQIDNKAPPLGKKVAVYLLNCVFRN